MIMEMQENLKNNGEDYRAYEDTGIRYNTIKYEGSEPQ
jgi:hypothetical protein